jgi:NADPH:quinone reductase-like Zn-dependent oxidoreductase
MSLPLTETFWFWQPKEGEVLIKVTSTAINPVDWKIRDTGIFVEEWPTILGSDAAGEIADVGANVHHFEQGDRVFFQGIIGRLDSCTFQQYVTMPAELVAHTPAAISDDEAAGVSLASVAVVAAFYHKDGLDIQPHPWQGGGDKAGKGKSIVILGGSSSVGQYAIQLARLSGFSNIVTASSPAHHQKLKELGATVILDRNTSSPSDYVEAAKSHPLGAVLDSISAAETGIEGVRILQAANPNGVPSDAGLAQSTLIHLIHVKDEIYEAAKEKGKAEILVKVTWGVGSSPHLRATAVEFTKALSGDDGYLSKGIIRPNEPLVIKGGLDNLEAALEKNKAGVSGQKVVIRPNGD